jgi:hypothetical protein
MKPEGDPCLGKGTREEAGGKPTPWKGNKGRSRRQAHALLQRIGKGGSKREGGPCPASKDREGREPKRCFQGKVQGKENLVRSNLQNILEILLGKSNGKKQANM